MEKDEEKLLGRRFIELAEASETQNRYTYTDFLGLAELDVFHRTLREIHHIPYALFGGHELCERQMVRFGSSEILGYEEDFPISCLKIYYPGILATIRNDVDNSSICNQGFKYATAA